MSKTKVAEKRDSIIENPLGTESIGKLLLRFGIPAVVSTLVNAAYNLIDQVLIGNAVGMLGIAATNVAFPLSTLSAAISFLIGTGGASNYNLRLGEGDKEAADAFAGNTLSLLAIIGIAVGTAALVFVHPLIFAFGSTEAIEPLALPYTAIVSIGMPFGIFTTGASALIRADGSPRYAMGCTLVGAALNLAVDPIIAFVLKWGIVGLAWSTTIGQIITACICVVYFVKKTKTISIKKEYIFPKKYLSGRICALGIAPCINQLGMSVLQITMNNTLRYYGALSKYGSNVPLGSVGAIAKLNTLFLAFTIGIGQGSQPLHGFNYGAKKYDRVKKTLSMAIIAASLISIAVFTVFQLFPRQIMVIFGEDDPLYVEFAIHYLRIFMFMTFANGIQPVAATFFTSIGKYKRGLLISLTRQIIFILPLLVILPLFFGLDGAIWAGPIADFCAVSVSAVMVFIEIRNINALQLVQL